MNCAVLNKQKGERECAQQITIITIKYLSLHAIQKKMRGSSRRVGGESIKVMKPASGRGCREYIHIGNNVICV
jgi:hypothetical protein